MGCLVPRLPAGRFGAASLSSPLEEEGAGRTFFCGRGGISESDEAILDNVELGWLFAPPPEVLLDFCSYGMGLARPGRTSGLDNLGEALALPLMEVGSTAGA